MRLEFDASPEDIRLFLDEAEEFLQIMESTIVQLEQRPEDPELLQEIFRAAHTLKGSSATLGHRRMAELTHAMESLLDKLRKGKLRANTHVVNTLFACIDVLKAFKEEIATGVERVTDIQAILTRLAEPENAAGLTVNVAAAVVTADPPAAEQRTPGAELTEAETERMEAARRRGCATWEVVADMAPECPMPSVRAFQLLLALKEIGEVLRSWPSQAEIEADQVHTTCRVIFASFRPQDVIAETLAMVPDTAVRLLTAVQPAMAPAVSSDAGAAEVATADARLAAKRLGRTVRVDVEALDNLMNQVGELVIDRTRLSQLISLLGAERDGDDWVRDLQTTAAHIGRVTAELQEEIMRARMLPVDSLFKKFPRLVRDVAQKAQKEVSFQIRGEETELDRSVIEEINDPLMHLLRNSIDHGLESPMDRLKLGKPSCGTVILEARHEENQIVLSVRDDGRGIRTEHVRQAAVEKGLITEEVARRLTEAEVQNLIFAPGFSTASKVSDISGRGVGLDVVHKNIERLNGTVEVISHPGKGTEFLIKLPLTLAIIRALMVQLGDETYALPLNCVSEAIRLGSREIQSVRQREVLINRGTVIPLLRLESVFELPPRSQRAADEVFVVVVNLVGKQVGLVVDGLVGEGDVVIKSLGKFVGEISGISGATILGDGSVALILDAAGLVDMMGRAERIA